MASSPSDGLERVSRLLWIKLNARATIATLFRTPCRQVPWPTQWAMGRFAVGAIAMVVASMFVLDGWAIAYIRRCPASLIEAFNRFTDLGKSGYWLWPIGLMLAVLAIFDRRKLGFSRQILAAWSVRLGFVFTAIAAPGLFVAIVKRLIGRARPLVAGDDVWFYAPFGWKVDYASFPSGHATTGFATLVAIGAIFPQARGLLWIYAVMVALSRVVVTAHHPSDVVAGAVVGTVGALLVRHWFAARRLGFRVGADGVVRSMPGPSLRRIFKAITGPQQTARS